jgi:hypothetical protein
MLAITAVAVELSKYHATILLTAMVMSYGYSCLCDSNFDSSSYSTSTSDSSYNYMLAVVAQLLVAVTRTAV